MEEGLIIHTDGGSRGNPGSAACAFVADKDGKEIFSQTKFLGKQTNNFAEYSAVILALEWINKELINFKRSERQNFPIIFYLDSELVVKQLNGIYRVKDETLRNLFYQVLTLIKQTGIKMVFKNVPRERNKIADALVNKELDKNQ